MSLAKTLKLLRIKRKLSQEELANKINVTPQAISNYERGVTTPSLEIIALLGEVLNFKFIINNGQIIIMDNERNDFKMDNIEINIDTDFLNGLNYYKGDSLFFDNNIVLSSLEDKSNGITLELMARGEIKIYDRLILDNSRGGDYKEYQDNEARNHLREVYKKHGFDYINENITIDNNNWWEVIYTLEDGTEDGMVVDLSKENSSLTLTNVLMECRQQLL